MEFQSGTPFVAEPPPMRQHFFLLWFPGLLDAGNFGKLFLKFFTEPRPEFETRLPPGSLAASHRGFAFCVADPIGSAHESTQIDIDGFALESGALATLRGTSADSPAFAMLRRGKQEFAPAAIRGN